MSRSSALVVAISLLLNGVLSSCSQTKCGPLRMDDESAPLLRKEKKSCIGACCAAMCCCCSPKIVPEEGYKDEEELKRYDASPKDGTGGESSIYTEQPLSAKSNKQELVVTVQEPPKSPDDNHDSDAKEQDPRDSPLSATTPQQKIDSNRASRSVTPTRSPALDSGSPDTARSEKSANSEMQQEFTQNINGLEGGGDDLSSVGERF